MWPDGMNAVEEKSMFQLKKYSLNKQKKRGVERKVYLRASDNYPKRADNYRKASDNYLSS